MRLRYAGEIQQATFGVAFLYQLAAFLHLIAFVFAECDITEWAIKNKMEGIFIIVRFLFCY